MAFIAWQVLLIVGLTFQLQFQCTKSECNVCQANQAACVNSTSFYLCFGEDYPDTGMMYHCKSGFECTAMQAICVQKNSARPPSCGDTSLCGMCGAHRNHLFACLGRTTFQMCYGALSPIGQIGYCPKGFVCDATSDDICVNSRKPHTITCDIVDDDDDRRTATSTTSTTTERSSRTPTSTEPSTTSTPNYPLTPNEVCAQMREVGLFPTMPHDPFCHRYTYCFYRDGMIRGIEYTCSGGSYYNIEDEMCTLAKPPYCI